MAIVLGKKVINDMLIVEVDRDPSIGAGTPAALGSIASAHDGSGVWFKDGSADTAWMPFQAGSGTDPDIAARVIHVNHTTGADDPVPSLIAGISVHRGAIAGIDRDHMGLFWDEGNEQFHFAENTSGDDTTLGADLKIRTGAIEAHDSIFVTDDALGEGGLSAGTGYVYAGDPAGASNFSVGSDVATIGLIAYGSTPAFSLSDSFGLLLKGSARASITADSTRAAVFTSSGLLFSMRHGVKEFLYADNDKISLNRFAEDLDLIVAGNTRVNLLNIDAGLDRVGINRAAGTHSATLDIDNLAIAESIFIARDNGTAVFTIADGGNITVAQNLSVNGNTTLGNASGDTLTINGTSVSIPNNLNINSNNLYIETSTNRIGYKTVTPGAAIDIIAGTLTDNLVTSASGLHMSATLQNAQSTQSAARFDITGAGFGLGNKNAFQVIFYPGWTGSEASAAGEFENVNAGTGNNFQFSALSNPFGNSGINGFAYGTTTGLNIGSYGLAANGNVNAGLVANATIAKAGATNIGTVSVARNSGGGGAIEVGGYFGLHSATPTFTSVALMADNGSTTAPIFVARDNGTAVLTVADNGDTVLAPISGHTDHAFTITAGTLASTKRALFITASFPGSAATQYASSISATTNVGQTASSLGLFIEMLPGYTSNTGNVYGMAIDITTAGTGTWNPLNGKETLSTHTANYGFWSSSFGDTSGTNIAARSIAHRGAISIGAVNASHDLTGSSNFRQDSLNIGSVNFVTAAKNGSSTTEKHIGVVGQALGGDTNVAGYFGLQSSAPTFASAALMADNGSTVSDIFVARDNGTPVFTIADGGISTLVGRITVTGGSFPAQTNAVTVTGVIPQASPGFEEAGARFTFSSTGSVVQYVDGLNTQITAGYSGAGTTVAVVGGNGVSGVGADLRLDQSGIPPLGNMGAIFLTFNTTTGFNVGVQGEAVGGILNIGENGKATTPKASATNIGVFGVGLNTSVTAPIHIGGFFGLMNTTPTFVSAALIADNGSTTSDIFVARDNGVPVFTIADGGTITLTGSISSGGSYAAAIITTTSASYAVLSTDYTILGNAVSNNITVNLPTAASAIRRVLNIKKIDASANTVTIDANGSELIDGVLTQVLTLIYESITIQSDGSAWYVI